MRGRNGTSAPGSAARRPPARRSIGPERRTAAPAGPGRIGRQPQLAGTGPGGGHRPPPGPARPGRPGPQPGAQLDDRSVEVVARRQPTRRLVRGPIDQQPRPGAGVHVGRRSVRPGHGPRRDRLGHRRAAGSSRSLTPAARPGRRGGGVPRGRTGWTTSGAAARPRPLDRGGEPVEPPAGLRLAARRHHAHQIRGRRLDGRASASQARRGSATRATSTPAGAGPASRSRRGPPARPPRPPPCAGSGVRGRRRLRWRQPPGRPAAVRSDQGAGTSASRSAPSAGDAPTTGHEPQRVPPARSAPSSACTSGRRISPAYWSSLPRDPSPVLDRRPFRAEPLPQVTPLGGGIVGVRRHRASMHHAARARGPARATAGPQQRGVPVRWMVAPLVRWTDERTCVSAAEPSS